MTLDEFRATRVECPDIGEALNDECMMGESGYLYDGSYYVAKETDPAHPNDYWMVIGNHWYGGALEEMERQLWVAFYQDSHEETTHGT